MAPNVVNNLNSTFNYGNANITNPQSGKLTLRKVWMEYQGVVSAKISPYLFNYAYPSPANGSKLHSFYGYSNGVYTYSQLTDNLQNPEYSPFALDAWGYPMPDGKERRMNGIAWIKQAAWLAEYLRFDPAAYHLKSIRLPSGSTIYIQYEPNDYAYVHNRKAMAMASIAGSEIALSTILGGYDKTPVYFINTEDLGVAQNNEQGIDALIEQMKSSFDFDGEMYGKKVYYKFLFSLIGKNSATLNNFQSDYITGYANIQNIEKAAQKEGWNIKITLEGENSNDGARALTPQQACYEFVTGQRQGKVQGNNGVEPKFEGVYDSDMTELANIANTNNLTIPFWNKFELPPMVLPERNRFMTT